MKEYIFYRKDTFYFVTLKDDADALKNVACNPGTVKVTDALGKRVIWDARADKKKQN